MTVKELIKHLKKGDPNAEVGVFGHFGEFYATTPEDFEFHCRKTNSRDPKQPFLIVNLLRMMVEIGPEPE